MARGTAAFQIKWPEQAHKSRADPRLLIYFRRGTPFFNFEINLRNYMNYFYKNTLQIIINYMHSDLYFRNEMNFFHKNIYQVSLSTCTKMGIPFFQINLALYLNIVYNTGHKFLEITLKFTLWWSVHINHL